MHANASPNAERGLQEIRFTRNAQAAHFFVLALVFFCVGIALYCLSLDLWKTQEPMLKQSWYGLFTLPFIALAVWAGVHLAKHAYMIFSPVGIEIFPFFYPFSRNIFFKLFLFFSQFLFFEFFSKIFFVALMSLEKFFFIFTFS